MDFIYAKTHKHAIFPLNHYTGECLDRVRNYYIYSYSAYKEIFND